MASRKVLAFLTASASPLYYPCSLQRYEAHQAGLFLSQRREGADQKWLNNIDFAPNTRSIQYLCGAVSSFFTLGE
jgi:hypothetical protein